MLGCFFTILVISRLKMVRLSFRKKILEGENILLKPTLPANAHGSLLEVLHYKSHVFLTCTCNVYVYNIVSQQIVSTPWIKIRFLQCKLENPFFRSIHVTVANLFGTDCIQYQLNGSSMLAVLAMRDGQVHETILLLREVSNNWVLILTFHRPFTSHFSLGLSKTKRLRSPSLW